MDISIFGEIKDDTEEKLTEIGVKYVYKYYPAKEELENNPTEVNELLELAYGKMIDLINILTKDKTQIQKVRAYRQEIQSVNKYVNYDLTGVYKDLKEINRLLEG